MANTTAYTVQCYYRIKDGTNSVGGNMQLGIGLDGTVTVVQSTAAALPAVTGTWTKWTATLGSTTSSAASPRYGVGFIRNAVAMTNTLYIDDFVVYAGTLDVTAPADPGAVAVTSTASSIGVSWSASSNVDGGGYVVIRYATTSPSSSDDPSTNGIYAVGNSITVSNTGTVRYIGTGTSFTDNVGLSASTDYYYKVYACDKAFNYSAESQSTAIQLCTTPSISAHPQSTQSICQNATPTNLSVTAAGTGITYQWYSNTSNSNSGGTSLGAGSGAQTATYTPLTATVGTLYYYCIVTGTCGTANSNTAAVIVGSLAGLSASSGTLTTGCDDATGFTAYKDGSNNMAFAINWATDGTLSSANAAAKAAAQVTITIDGAYTSLGTTPNRTYTMKRYWNVANAGSFDEPVTVRFFYDAAEKTAVQAAPGATQFIWFKSSPSFDPMNGLTGVTELAGTESTVNSVNYVEFTNITGFSGGTGVASESAVLSTELTSFNVKPSNNTNLLTWTTATEKNNMQFNIERSANGSNFTSIGTVKGSGTTTKATNYTFTDETPLSISYYRLQSVDFNGKTQASNIVSVFRSTSGKLKVYPTVASDKLTILADNNEAQTFNIVDLMGKTIQTGQLNGQKELSISTLATGTYVLKVGIEVVKFVKQ